MTTQEARILAMIMVWVTAVMLLIGFMLGSGFTSNPERVLEIACKSACERSHSEMLSVQENVCFCKNLTAMSGDYGQLFLKGR